MNPVLFVQAALARTYPRVAWMFRHRGWLIQETVLPLLSVSAFVYVYRSMNAPPEFAGFVILGAAMTTFWMNVLWSMGAHLYFERDSGNLELYILAPAPLMSILAGMAMGGMMTTFVRATTITLAGVWLFDVSIHPTNWGLLVLVLSLTLTAMYGLGMMFASLFLLWGREAWHAVELLQEPVYLLTGNNFPIKVFSKMLHWAIPAIALLIPMTAGMDAMRQLLFANNPDSERWGFLSVETEVILLAILSATFLVLARWSLAFMERKARQEGRITVRWQ